MEWSEVRLGDVAKIKHGFAFEGKYFKSHPTQHILLTPGNFKIGGGFKEDKLKFYEGPVPSEFILNNKDLIISMTDLSKDGDTLGLPVFVPSNKKTYLHNQRLGKVIIKSPDIDSRYLYYLMSSKKYRDEILSTATGSTVKHTAPNRIESFKFQLPPLSEQKRIAHILGSLDDKIELNRKMNETLEQMARAIFKSWFVDFDPVHAKAAGKKPFGMDDATAALFPDSFEESELGLIPKGWRVKELGDLFEFAYGKPLKAEDRHPGTFPVLGSNGIIGWHQESYVKGPGVVIGRKGNPGVVTYVAKDFYPIDTTFYLLPKIDELKNAFFFSSLVLEKQNLPALSGDSAVPGLNRNLAYLNRICISPRDIIDIFNKKIASSIKLQTLYGDETQNLCLMRNLLLQFFLSSNQEKRMLQ